MRAQAGVRHALQELCAEGDCAAEYERLALAASELLAISRLIIEQAVHRELEEGNLIAERIGDRSCLFLASLYRAETGVAHHLLRLLRSAFSWGQIDPLKAIPWVEGKTGLTLSRSQQEAVAQAISNKVTVITGGPGVGKTTVVNNILWILRAKRVKVLLCAPTGRAAKRLAESTSLPAKTIHRLLEFDPKSFDFKRDSHYPLEADLVVVDEVSMVDVVLMNQLLRAIPDQAALLMVGDVDQLPSVGPGAVLFDVIGSGVVPTV